MEEKTVIGNVCFILDKTRTKILLLKRAREPMQNLYTGVGGKLEWQESVYESVFREVMEETGISLSHATLKGVIKTILEGKNSTWLLFIYTASSESDDYIECEEGSLQWVSLDELHSLPLIGFIREILPCILHETEFLEGRIHHDIQGNTLFKKLHISDTIVPSKGI